MRLNIAIALSFLVPSLSFAQSVAPKIAPKIAPKAYRLPSVSLKDRIIWGSTCEGANGFVLAFGGQDQRADFPPRTRIKDGDQWKPLEIPLAVDRNLVHDEYGRLAELAITQKDLVAVARKLFFQGLPDDVLAKRIADLVSRQTKIKADVLDRLAVVRVSANLTTPRTKYDPGFWSIAKLDGAFGRSLELLRDGKLPDAIKEMHLDQIRLEQAADGLHPEPAPRCLSPLVFDAKTGLFVLFGGDHLDYLTNDLWVFDPAKKKWQSRHPGGPTPRANHQWKAAGDGKVVLIGGYTYTSSTSYNGGQYRDVDDGEWTYDIAADTFTNSGNAKTSTEGRVYRTGPFHPDYFLEGDKPDAAATAKALKDLPTNRWVERKTPKQPELMRTWGHAVFDPDGDRVLVFSGGHSAHGGSDVLHYHLATSRWELPFPVEFPLGQLYANTEYPDGFNLNRRPWVTGHTYQNYNYDLVTKKMYFVGQRNDCYIYDPELADWTGRFPRPKSMLYNDAFYTLEVTQTPSGLVCWTQAGKLLRLEQKIFGWNEIALNGDKLPGAVVDASTFVFDSKRDRFLFFRGEYGKPYSGDVHIVDAKTGAVKRLTPPGAAGLLKLNYREADHAAYLPDQDLVLFGALLPGDNPRRSLAYDCAGDRWISLAIDYEIGKNKRLATPYGSGHSCGLMFDARRGLIWGVDTHELRVYALRLNMSTAGVRPLEP